MTTPSADAAADDAAGGSVVTIGVFDGVHRGHQALLSIARERADLLGLPLVAMTFDPHPMSVVGPRRAPTSLATLDHRIALLRQAGADRVDVLHFDEATAAMAPTDFIDHVLVERLGAREVVVGANFRFGHRAAGSLATLEASGAERGLGVVGVALVGDEGRRWSSTTTRSLIEAGDVAAAALALGRPYRIDGEVVHGDHRGRELGFPTANVSTAAVDRAAAPTVPADGVYAGWVVLLDEAAGPALPAAISIGTNPQFAGSERRVEAYVLDRTDLELYGRQVGVEFADRIRGQEMFDDVDQLVRRIGADVERARAIVAPS